MTAVDTERLLAIYDSLSRTTGLMLGAAQGGDWERLVSLEKDCADLIARLSQLENEDAMSATLRTRKVALIRKVLADDAAIRAITEPWIQRLEAMLGSNRCEQRLLRSYGPPAS